MANRFWTLLLLLAAAMLPGTVAQTSSTPSLADMPQCALLCLVDATSHSSCAITNQTCLCTNTQLQADVTTCVLGNCTIKEGLLTQNITAITCQYPVHDKTQQLRTVAIVMACLSGSFLLARILYRLFLARGGGGSRHIFASDDWMCLATFMFGVPSTTIGSSALPPNGMGRDIWTLSYNKIYQFGKLFYVVEVMYFANLTLLKMTMLLFYLRIFPPTGVRRAIWATVVFLSLYGLIFVLLAIFQCQPISYFWTKWDGEHQGSCLGINAIGWANAGISVVLDFWMLAIPIHQVRKLTLHWKKKIGVVMMFCVGFFVTIVSILRLQTLVTFGNSSNPTWDSYQVTKWSFIEINTGIICACMPTCRLLLVHFFPKVFGSTRSQNTYDYNDRSYNNNNSSGANRLRSGDNIGNSHNSRGSRSIPLVLSPVHNNADKVHAGNTTDIECSAGGRGGAQGSRRGQRSDSVSSSSSPRSKDVDEDANDDVNDKSNGGRIMYSKTYGVEYGVEDHDQASLVHQASAPAPKQTRQ